MTKERKRVLSCIQPTSEMHIGNYFGAVANWVAMQEDYDCIYGVVDLHAMTMPYQPRELRNNTERMVIELMACGIDPQKSIIFIQSLVPEHTELSWIFNCISPFGELTRMTQFKDKREMIEAKAKPDQFVSTGIFTYPVLQAADILIYRANYVPVGKDQEQHLELSRNIAERFNKWFGEYFPVPAPKFTPVPKIMSTADPTKKMSKSLGEKHYIGLFEDENSLRKKIMSAVTDAGPATLPPGVSMSTGTENLFEILKACGRDEQATALLTAYKEKSLKYVDLKNAVVEALIELTSRLKARKAEIESNKQDLWKQIYEMSAKAREIASETMREVRKRVGLPPHSL
ncbi:MAG: tryptophan--tRNA ligase [bacterium]